MGKLIDADAVVRKLEATKYDEAQFKYASDEARRIFTARNKGIDDAIAIVRETPIGGEGYE